MVESSDGSQVNHYQDKSSGSSGGYLAGCSDTEESEVFEGHVTYTECLDRTRTTLSASTGDVVENARCLGRTRTTLSASVGGLGQEFRCLDGTRSTLNGPMYECGRFTECNGE